MLKAEINTTILEEYSTQRPHIILKEYGRNVQMIARQIQAKEDKEERTKMAYTLVELMKQVNPALRDNQDYNQKIWDDLFIICGFNLDVDMPYTRPDKTILDKKPEVVPYNTNNLRFRHYGRNIELLVEQAIATEDADDKEAIVIFVGKMMKRFYHTWNSDVPEDSVIVRNIEELSKGKLTLDMEKVKSENLLHTSYKENANYQGSSSDRRESNNNNRNNNRGGDKRKGGGGGKRFSGPRNNNRSRR